MDCIFCMIAEGKIPSKKAYEDEDILAFYDINPQAPVHVLVIPKSHIASLDDVNTKNSRILNSAVFLFVMCCLFKATNMM